MPALPPRGRHSSDRGRATGPRPAHAGADGGAPTITAMDVLERLRQGAAEVFDGGPVLFAYLFGSHATGRAHPRSDVDVAVYLDDEEPRDRYLDLSLRLAGELERTCGVAPVEALVVLNQAPITLAGRVLQQRQVIYSRHEPARVRFESLTFRQFHDFERHAEPLRRQRLQAIARGKG